MTAHAPKNSVGIDVRMAQHTGIGRYIRGVVHGLSIINSSFQYTLIGKRASQKDFPHQFSFFPTETPIYSLREQLIPFEITRMVDCLHTPHYNAPLLWRRKLVITIHDLIHLRFPNYLTSPLAQFYANVMLPAVTRRADAIIAVSECTKNDLIERLKVDPKKITVIYHGINSQFLKKAGLHASQSKIQEPYFLYVGLIKAHKNLGTLLEAFRNLKNKSNLPQLKLYLVGTIDEKQKIVREWMAMLKAQNDISVYSNVDDGRLKELYQNALALVFPSFYEGFGFPLIEAMATQTPIIASQAASIPEVLGEKAALFFDPHSVSELQNCMEQILRGEDLRQKLIQEGSKRLALFDWNAAARKTEQVYESAIGN